MTRDHGIVHPVRRPGPLAAADVQTLQAIYQRLRAGDPAGAEAALRALPAAVRGHPDALQLLGLVLKAQDRLAEAIAAFEAALAWGGANAELWKSYAGVLASRGDIDAALRAYDRALALNPAYVDAWIDKGLAASRAERFDIAEQALARATELAPGLSAAWRARGLLERSRGRLDEAQAFLSKAIDLNPRDGVSLHNLGVTLRELDRSGEALAQFEAVIAAGPVHVNTLVMRAHVLADLGRFEEAIADYRAVIARAPDHVDAHETLATLLPQLGREGEAFDAYDEALGRAPESPALWRSAIGMAASFGEAQRAGRWAEAAAAACGPALEWAMARARAAQLAGDWQEAHRRLEPLLAQAPDSAELHAHLAAALIALGDPKSAETHALAATRLQPLDQTGWAYLTIIWRLRGDPREMWLADYDRLVIPVDLELPFLPELAETLHGMHDMRAQPAEQTLRHGTQTRGNLFDRRTPVLRALADSIRAAVARRLQALPRDPAHPFLGRIGSGVAFSGSWSVRLRDEGFHINHIHPQGWLSSALHIALPADMSGEGEAGALVFGSPDAALGLDLPPRRIERPVAGRLILFPSYMWHGTVPFRSSQPRLTLAFDALPVG